MTEDLTQSRGDCQPGWPPLTTRHVYDGLNVVAEYDLCWTGQGWGNQVTNWHLAREFVWGNQFPEPLALIDWTELGDDPTGNPETLYYLRDALGSVIGLMNDPNSLDPNSFAGHHGGSVPASLVERYDYDPYGRTYITCRDPAVSDPNAANAWELCDRSRYGNPWMWTGQRYDVATGLYHFLFRTYSPTLGRWMQRDPLGYVDGMSLYQYVRGHAVTYSDWLGLLKLCMNSNIRQGEGGSGREGPKNKGHAWASLEEDDGTLRSTYGLWPDEHRYVREQEREREKQESAARDEQENDAGSAGAEDGGDPGDDQNPGSASSARRTRDAIRRTKSDVRKDLEKQHGESSTGKTCVELDDEMVKRLNEFISREFKWTLEHNCVWWVAELWNYVTGERVDAKDPTLLGYPTPRKIAEEIQRIEGEHLKEFIRRLTGEDPDRQIIPNVTGCGNN